ncbi:MAG: tyrosine-type recombinase/integrase [Acholeplasmataceae bacterium]|jgi:site-specific recombinase XerD|nr:tyrosine-type recombinase/integrase [Acholeplasmataceae bacterium]
MIKHHPLEEPIKTYIENLDMKQISIKSYHDLLKRYLNYLKSHNIKYPKRADLIKYRESMWEEGLKANTIQKQMVVIRAFYLWLKINYKSFNFDDTYAFNIAEGIKGARIDRNYKKEPLSLEQARHLLEVCYQDRHNIYQIRNYAIILLMLTTGMRTIEVVRARKQDLSRMDHHSILYIQGKAKDGTDNFVKLPIEVTDAINDYLHLRADKNKYIFISHEKNSLTQMTTHSLRTSIKRLMRKAGINNPKQTVHSLRHTTAYFNLKSGGTLEATQQLLRHKNIETTLIYAHNINRIDDDSEFRIRDYILKKEENKHE